MTHGPYSGMGIDDAAQVEMDALRTTTASLVLEKETLMQEKGQILAEKTSLLTTKADLEARVEQLTGMSSPQVVLITNM